MGSILQDLRYALRTLRQSPGFAAVAVLTLALGIGTTTAIFSVVNSVLLRPLSFAEPERIVRVFHDAPEGGFAVSRGAFSPQDFEDLEQASTAYEHLAAFYFVPGQSNSTLLEGGEPEEVATALVSSRFFTIFGVVPELGRTLAADEHVPGADRVVVLSSGFWRSRFGANPDIAGRSVTLNGEPYTVVGVMPPSFDFPSREVAMWLPLSLIGEDDIPHRRGLRWMQAVARLAPATSLGAAGAETNAVLRRLEAQYPDTNDGWGSATVTTLKESLVGDVRPALLLLFGAVGVVLLIACANLANLLLARGSSRGRELAVRVALGAGRARLVRQLLTESIALGLAGGVLGLGLALLGSEALVALSAGTIPRPEEISVDAGVAAFAFLVSVLTGIVFGLMPSLAVSTVNVQKPLNEGGRGSTTGRGNQSMRHGLVVTQTALAVVLLVGAGLLIRSFWNLTHVDPGFAGQNVLTASIPTSGDILDDGRRGEYRREILRRIEAVPGVLAVGGSKTLPLHGGGEPYAFSLPGRSDPTPITPEAGVMIVTPGYFEALNIPLLRGRAFSTADETAASHVLIVNRAFARRYLAPGDPVGESLRLGEQDFRIVGVVGDVRIDGIAQEPAPAVYVPAAILPRSSMKLFIRTATDPLRVAADVRQVIWQVNPNQPVSDIATMQQVVSEAVARPRFLTLLLASFAGLAIVIAALGVYAVIAYAVSRRRYEIGIRMALGARAGDVLRLVLYQGMRPAVAGVVIGLVGALALTRALSSLLYDVAAADPATFAGVALLLVAVAVLASYLPARQAASVDPTSALRTE